MERKREDGVQDDCQISVIISWDYSGTINKTGNIKQELVLWPGTLSGALAKVRQLLYYYCDLNKVAPPSLPRPLLAVGIYA